MLRTLSSARPGAVGTLSGWSLASVSTFSIAASVSSPPTTLPNTVCLLSRCLHDRYVMKNWLLLVLGPALAMLSTPRPVRSQAVDGRANCSLRAAGWAGTRH